MTEGYDYHFLVLAPDLQSAWFFQAGRQFWQRFQPIVTDNWKLLSYVPPDKSIAVTILSRPDTATEMQSHIEQQHGNMRIDLIITNDLPLMESVLNNRAKTGSPFG